MRDFPSEAWAEAFVRAIAPYVLARDEDLVLILPPNKVYKLNATGMGLLRHLMAGGRLAEVPGMDPLRREESLRFIAALHDLYEGRVPAGESCTGTVPYDFNFTRLPVLAEIALTYRCNNRCLFCYAGCPGAKTFEGELDPRGFKKVIDLFRSRAKVPFFSFSGGEPLLHEGICELARHARKRGLRTNLVSNGTLATPSLARALKAAGLESAQVSLEGDDAALHDALVGRQGAFDEALAGIAALRAAGIAVQTNTTLTAMNRGIAARMPAFLASIGLRRFAMNLYIPASPASYRPDLLLPYAEVGPLVDAVAREARARGLAFFWYSPTPFCHYNPIARGLGNKSCAAMDGLLSVNPRGEVLPCSSYDEPMGNLLREDFGAIWFSQRAAHFKQKGYAPAGCKACSAFVACQAACPLYWRAVGEGEIEGRAFA